MKTCACGCGQTTNSKYVRGHHWKAIREANMEPPNPSGLCECGCGEMAPIAPYTSKHYGWVKGQYKRFIAGHQCGGPMTPPNPSGLCFCGCGKNTPIARQSDRSSGRVAFQKAIKLIICVLFLRALIRTI